ncbi:MAG: formylglycine-generating enzyme family protein [Deltaproteobacteria bacterium]|jgi:formylglycine-generating enzyme required for sulfatase activity|nr:formylglycine-generating enzyme family protein [Deltaproteobacteria bacterium]
MSQADLRKPDHKPFGARRAKLGPALSRLAVLTALLTLLAGGFIFWSGVWSTAKAQAMGGSRRPIDVPGPVETPGETPGETGPAGPPEPPAPESNSLSTARPVTSNLGLVYVLIPAGSFMMGAGPGFQGDGEYERPAREVRITKPFRLSRAEVTVSQWFAIMNDRPSRNRGSDMPVENVGWDEVQEFLKRLGEREGRGYRLPTEAEWEYAARGGTSTAYWFGNDPGRMKDYGYCGENFGEGSTHPVMGAKANPFGLYDMNGNVSEWVADWFAEDYYARGPRNDPKGPPTGAEKVHRGGAYASDPKVCQSAWRDFETPGVNSFLIGFRVAYDE